MRSRSGKSVFYISALLFLAMALGVGIPMQAALANGGAPSTVWVNGAYDASSCTAAGHTWGVDCFAAIQDGVNALSSGGTIHVAAGTYAESVSITVPGVNIVLTAGTLMLPSSPCFTVSASNTTLNGGVCVPSGGSDGILTGAAVNNLVIKNMEIRNGSGTGDGIHLGHNIKNLQIINTYFHNMGGDGIEYAAGTTVTGVHEIQGNRFQLDGGYGINNASGNPYVVEYNSWNDIAGPAGTNGDGVSANLDYTPWTYVALSMVSSGSPVANKVGEGYQITYTINMDAAEVFGADFDLNYDSTKLSVVSATNAGSFTQRELCTINTATPGIVSFCGSRTPLTTALNGTAQPVFTVVFQGLSSSTPGAVTLDLDGTDDVFGMAPPSGASNNIFASALTDGSLTVYDATTVTGRVDLQGRPDDSGAVMTFGTGSGMGYGPFTSNTTTYFGDVSLSSVVWDTYTVTVSMARYLDVTVASARSAVITADNQVLSTLVLLGGDADDSNTIDIFDAVIIGGQFGTDGSGDPRSDINNDGIIDIFDLVLMGGNFGKTSAAGPDAGYAGWTP